MNWSEIEGTRRTIAYSTNPERTVRVMQNYAQLGATHPEVIALAESIEPGDYKKLFDTVYSKVRYEPDPDDEQIIRWPHRTLKDSRGNCVDYTVLFSAILHCWNIPHIYRIASFGEGFEHVYPIAEGVVLDAVVGQRQDGSEGMNGRSRSCYNCELEYVRFKDFNIKMPKLTVLGSTRNAGSSRPGSLNGLLDMNPCTSLPQGPCFSACKCKNKCKELFIGDKAKACACWKKCQNDKNYSPRAGDFDYIDTNIEVSGFRESEKDLANQIYGQPNFDQPPGGGSSLMGSPIIMAAAIGAGVYFLTKKKKKKSRK